ncbi:hypothetical protein CDEST_01057 [Colletotrichum destructivum]|uniref:Uncharacterized protein n=1 Tax=Colletotrichum destructivum TaxID=34406 RepID=A0AAX4HZ60_9PEZI|nr:hypothetical protein CDEST_01057 [Colletotrichum destructivum]
MCGETYGRLDFLDHHFASPVHQQAYYHCLWRACSCGFTILAAAINHLETKTCDFMMFDAVQNSVGRMFDPRGMASF